MKTEDTIVYRAYFSYYISRTSKLLSYSVGDVFLHTLNTLART